MHPVNLLILPNMLTVTVRKIIIILIFCHPTAPLLSIEEIESGAQCNAEGHYLCVLQCSVHEVLQARPYLVWLGKTSVHTHVCFTIAFHLSILYFYAMYILYIHI